LGFKIEDHGKLRNPSSHRDNSEVFVKAKQPVLVRQKGFTKEEGSDKYIVTEGFWETPDSLVSRTGSTVRYEVTTCSIIARRNEST